MNAILHIPVAQTAFSEGYGPAWANTVDARDLANLDLARRQHLRRMASDAVDHLIALLDALDAPFEDLEPDQDGGEGDDASDLEDDGTAEPSLGAPERHPDLPPPGYTAGWGRFVDRSIATRQTGWGAGGSCDHEVEDEHDEESHDREDEHDGREPDADEEGTALERFGRGFLASGPDDVEEEDGCEQSDNGVADEDGYHEQCGAAVAGALPWSTGGFVV